MDEAAAAAPSSEDPADTPSATRDEHGTRVDSLVKKGDELERILSDMRAERSCSKVASKLRKKIRALVHDRVGAIDIDLAVYIAGVLHFSVPPAEVTLDKYTCSGLMWKKGNIHRNWNLRYFVFDLRERQFRYYASQSAPIEKGKFMLEEVTQVERVPDNKQYPFLMNVATKGRVFHFRAESEAVLNVWLVAFDSINATT